MKLSVYTVNGTKLEYEMNETETVLSLKEKIGKDRGLKSEKINLFLRKSAKGLFSYFLGSESILLNDDNQSLMDLNYKEDDSFLCTLKMENAPEKNDNKIVFNLNGEEKSFDEHEILNMNYAQFKQKFNIPENEDVEFSYKFNCFKDNHPSISFKKFNRDINDIKNGEVKCIVKLNNNEEIEVGLPEKSRYQDLKLKLFNYYDDLKKPFKLIPSEDYGFFDEYSYIIYSPDSPDKKMKFFVKLN